MAAGAQGNYSDIKEWRSIITLIVFIIANLVVLFPFHVPIPIPRRVANGILYALSNWRIIAPRQVANDDDNNNGKDKPGFWVWLQFPMNFVTAPLVADVFLLAISAIGGDEVKQGTIGDDKISPLDIMLFFFTLAYIAISIDASGLIRWLAFKVLMWGGDIGHKLFFYLYAFFFVLGSFIGNDPIVLSGTAFLAYMTRVSSNIIHPRAWIHTQFAIANIASAILVSSNPTNLVLAGAFNIKFIQYTVRMIVPVIITAIVLFPFLLYVVYANPDLIPEKIEMHELPEELRTKKPVNPNIPNARGFDEEEESIHTNDEQGKIMSLEEIMNPYIDWGGAAFGAIIMAATLITLLVLNADSTTHGAHRTFWVTLPAAFVMLCWDVAFGWIHRVETRRIAAEGRRQVEEARAARQRAKDAEEARKLNPGIERLGSEARDYLMSHDSTNNVENDVIAPAPEKSFQHSGSTMESLDNEKCGPGSPNASGETLDRTSSGEDVLPGDVDVEKHIVDAEQPAPVIQPDRKHAKPMTLVSWAEDRYKWCQETFPTVTAVLSHLPYGLIPFAFCMFVLVEGLENKGWVSLFAAGWNAWVEKTGTIGAIVGMGFLSVVLCNFAGTNIGTTILLCRVILEWAELRYKDGKTISEQTFLGTIYSMALGVNYGAFSTAFSASLAGLLWRDILSRKHIHVGAREFARENIPIIAIAMTVGCAALIGEVYIFFSNHPADLKSVLDRSGQ